MELFDLVVAKENSITLEYLYNTSIEQYHLLCYSTILEFDKRNQKE